MIAQVGVPQTLLADLVFSASSKIPIKMGWLEKKGEHLKLWRRRFLVLYDDGVFNGYKAAPSDEDIRTGSGTLENLFNVKSKYLEGLQVKYTVLAEKYTVFSLKIDGPTTEKTVHFQGPYLACQDRI